MVHIYLCYDKRTWYLASVAKIELFYGKKADLKEIETC